MKCVKHVPTGNINRVPNAVAKQVVNNSNGEFVYVSKKEYKEYVKGPKNESD